MATVDSVSNDDNSNPASPRRRHVNAWGYGKDLSETSAYVLLAQNGSSSPRLCSSMRKLQREQAHNADKATRDGEGGTDRSTHSKVVPVFLRKISAVSPRKYHAIYRVGSFNQVCVAKNDAEGNIDSCNPIPTRRNIHPIRSSGNNPHVQRKTVYLQGIRDYAERIWDYTHKDRETI